MKPTLFVHNGKGCRIFLTCKFLRGKCSGSLVGGHTHKLWSASRLCPMWKNQVGIQPTFRWHDDGLGRGVV